MILKKQVPSQKSFYVLKLPKGKLKAAKHYLKAKASQKVKVAK